MDSNIRVNGIGALRVLPGIMIILVPWIIFPVCEMGRLSARAVSCMQSPLPCGWTARADSGFGALIIVACGLLIARNTPETRQVVAFLPAHRVQP